MTDRSYVLGIDCALYYVPFLSRTLMPPQDDSLADPPVGPGVKPVAANPSVLALFNSVLWTLLSPVQDVTLNMTGATWDGTTRASSTRWRQMVQTLLECSLDFKILWLPDNAVFTELL